MCLWGFDCKVELSDKSAVLLLDGDRANNDFILQHDTDDQEDKVEQEHEEAQKLAHSPPANCDGDYDEEEHEEEEDDGAEQAIAAHLDWLKIIDDVVQEPGEWQTRGRAEIKAQYRAVIWLFSEDVPVKKCCVYWWTHPTVMSKMLEPTELDTAMSPRPFRATITLVIKSGIDVPAANMVKPMISSVIQKVSPTYESKD